MTSFRVRRATPQDVDALRELCGQLSRDRGSLASARREAFDPGQWLTARVPLVVVSDGPRVIGFAAAIQDTLAYSSPRCAELVVGVTASERRHGAGRAAIFELFTTARTMGLWKLVAFAVPEDNAARTLLARADFREVGTYEKHVQLEGAWRNVTVHERMLMTARRSHPAL